MEAQACVAYGLSYCWIKVQVAGLKCRIVKFHFLMRRILYPLQEAEISFSHEEKFIPPAVDRREVQFNCFC